PYFDLVATPPRPAGHDVWLARDRNRTDDLPAGAMVGTASLRRQGQILALCPQLELKTVRGNVEPRLGRLDEGAVDALILAAAGLERLQIRREHSLALKPPGFLPSAGQGAIVVQCRAGDDAVRALAKPMD